LSTETDENTSGFGDSVAVATGAVVPVPLSVVVCGEPLALSATETVALNGAEDNGVNVIVMEQDVLAASVAPHVEVCAKSLGFAPPIVMLEMLSVALPVLDSVRLGAVAVPFTVSFPKLSVEGVSVAVGVAAAVPVPLSVAVCGEPVASSATDTVALKVVADAGLKTTVMVHDVLAASVAPHVVVSEKSLGFVPPMVMLDMFSVDPLVFDSVRFVPADEVFTVWLPNANGDGESVAVGVDADVPAPVIVNVASSGFVTLLLMVSVVGYEPTAVGVNVTVMVQVLPVGTLNELSDGSQVPASVYSVGGDTAPFGYTKIP
jgi:hypothetical protein